MRLIEQVWFNNHYIKWLFVPLLFPLTLLFSLLTLIRRCLYRLGIKASFQISKPIIVVGNIGVGGNGKTPVVIFLVEQCLQQGLKVGVISRGYGGKAPYYPYLLTEHSTAKEAGDEPILIYKRCHVPVAVGSDRVANAKLLVAEGCDVIITDDGLQHYRLQRDVEILVVDGKRGFGNGLLLPSGPLREGVWRLNQADFVLINGNITNSNLINSNVFSGNEITMNLAPEWVCNIVTGEKIPISVFYQQFSTVNAMAGIGDPQRFFTTLIQQKFNLNKSIGFVDHHNFSLADFDHFDNKIPLLMTEKDAVKCYDFSKEHWWYVPVNAFFCKNEIKPLINKLMSLVSKSG